MGHQMGTHKIFYHTSILPFYIHTLTQNIAILKIFPLYVDLLNTKKDA